MDRFLVGYYTPPVKKQKVSDSADLSEKEKRKAYESKRERSFQNSWKAEYKWLVYHDDKKTMTCSVCSLHEKIGSFVSGCPNLRLEAIKKHSSSTLHIDNCRKEEAKRHKVLEESQAGRSLLQLNKVAHNKLCNLFRNAHYVAKLGRPYTDYVPLCKLDAAKSIDIGKTYLTDKACQHFISVIADDCRQKQDEMTFNKASFISIISDGSTDCSSQEAEILYARCAVRGKINTHFLGIKNVAKADGSNITSALTKMLDNRFGDRWKTKLTSMGTDGASVMLGNKSGVVQRLREITGRPIYAVHCSAHRLELAYRDVTKNHAIIQKCELLLLNLYLFYKYSPLNRANLKSSFKSLGETPIVPTRVGGTRWLPHTKKALEHLLKGSKAIVQHLEQLQGPETVKRDSSAKARNFLKALKDKRLVMWLHFLLDIVNCLSDVSLVIQANNCTVSDVWLELQGAKQIISSYKTRDGPSLQKVGESNLVPFGSGRDAVLNALVDSIDGRFDGDLKLFRGSSILKLKQWPKIDEDYGDEFVEQLVSLASPALEGIGAVPDKVMAEWIRLKFKLYNSEKVIKDLSWEEIWHMYDEDFPNLMALTDYLLTIPSSSVDAERGFSRMKIVKNDWRSRLGEKNLSDLMMLYLESPSIEDFDPNTSVQLWYGKGQRIRRPFYMDDVMSCDDPVNLGVCDVEDEAGEEEHFEALEEYETVDCQDTTDFDMSLHDVRLLLQKKYELFLTMENV